ncbi:MAG: hypothetical protein QOJ92_1996 [Frankiales bacterium]|nr:hypothetical protein [Frankiales bacterium]
MDTERGEVRLALEPTSASAVTARRAASSAVRASGLADLAPDVAIVVSELVTNAVLHARTRVEVRILLQESGVRVEVVDDGPADLLPTPEEASESTPDDLELQTTTGRGLAIVTALVESWGVDPGPEGKLVWAELGTSDRPRRVSSPTPAPPVEPSTMGTPVRLVAVPVRLALASEGNIEDLARELDLARLAQEHPEAIGLLDEVRELLGGYRDAIVNARRAAMQAWEAGRRLIDVNFLVRPESGPRLRRLTALLEQVAALCQAGKLLSLAPSEEVLAFRRWCSGEIDRQLDGAQPSACPFPVAAPTAGGSAGETVEDVDRPGRMLLDLQAVTAALAGADDSAAVNDIVLSQVGTVIGADTCSVSLLASDGETLELAGARGFDSELSAHWATYPLSADLPASEVVRTGRAVYLGSQAEIVAAYPGLEGRPLVGSQALAVLPLTVADGRVLGALALGYPQTREWQAENRAVLGLVADAVAQALDRARLHDAERAAAERLRFLADASDLLSRSLEMSLAMSSLAELAVPRLGDWCSIHVLENGRPVPIALAAVDPAKLELARTLQTEWPVTLGEGTIGRCLVDGEPGRWQVLPDELLPTIARDERHLAVLRALEMGAGIVLPLVTGGEVVGALAIANLSGRPLEDGDVALAQDLAMRAGASISNARLFGQQRDIAQALQRSLLPQALPRVEGLELGVAYAAAGIGEEVGGDFYDLLPVPGGLLVSIGDVRGRGVEAAALTGLARHTIRALGRMGLAPDQILHQLDEALRESSADDEPESAFCTALTGRLERDSGQLRFLFASGGHPAPFLLRAGATEVQRPSVRGDLLGVLPDIELVVTEVPLHEGDLLVLVTDGVLERRREGAFFDDEGVVRTILERPSAGASALAAGIADAARAFAPGATSDDMAVVVLRVTGS